MFQYIVILNPRLLDHMVVTAGCGSEKRLVAMEISTKNSLLDRRLLCARSWRLNSCREDVAVAVEQ